MILAKIGGQVRLVMELSIIFFKMKASLIVRQTYQSDCRLLYCYFRKVFLESPNLIHLCTFLCSIVRYEPLEAAARLPTYVVHEAVCVAVARIIIASLSVLWYLRHASNNFYHFSGLSWCLLHHIITISQIKNLYYFCNIQQALRIKFLVTVKGWYWHTLYDIGCHSLFLWIWLSICTLY